MNDRLKLGLLEAISKNEISLDDCGDWMRDRLVDLTMNNGGPMLIDTTGPSVFLTEAGKAALTSA